MYSRFRTVIQDNSLNHEGGFTDDELSVVFHYENIYEAKPDWCFEAFGKDYMPFHEFLKRLETKGDKSSVYEYYLKNIVELSSEGQKYLQSVISQLCLKNIVKLYFGFQNGRMKDSVFLNGQRNFGDTSQLFAVDKFSWWDSEILGPRLSLSKHPQRFRCTPDVKSAPEICDAYFTFRRTIEQLNVFYARQNNLLQVFKKHKHSVVEIERIFVTSSNVEDIQRTLSYWEAKQYNELQPDEVYRNDLMLLYPEFDSETLPDIGYYEEDFFPQPETIGTTRQLFVEAGVLFALIAIRYYLDD